MSPLRILIIAALLYIGYRLITGGRKKDSGSKDGKTEQVNGPVEDVLVEDPVCHALVPKRQAIHLNHEGGMVYFCSEQCCKKFVDHNGADQQS